ncbi:MAG: S-layer homology domain-containing protein, partial [Bacillota bacterium]|nr:S-layer homology domain-containing protein [Bacillota bacterium]
FASIDENTGVLTAKAAGSATVRAASVNTPAVYGETSITVNSPPPVLTGITVSGASGAKTVQSGSTLQMTSSFIPSGIADSVKWSISTGSGFASIDENTGVLTAKAAGSVTVRAASVNTPAVFGEIVITVTAIPTPPSGNSGGSKIKPPSAAVDTKNGTTTAVTEVSAGSSSNGVASASITEEQIGSAVSKAAEDAKGKESDKTELIINVKTSDNITGVSVTMPRAAFNKAAGGGIDALTLSSPAVSVTFDKAALSEIKAKGTGDFSITAKLMSPGNLSQEDREKVGGRPVYNLTVTSDNKAISDLGGGKATVSIPYKLAPGEDPNKIVIYYISGSGSMTMIPGCIYNPSTGMVTFATEHFSVYAVAYNDVGFKDVSGWYGDYVNYLAARGIISGGKDGVFSPDANITRAEFITIMANLSGSAPDGYAAPSFSDVSTADWYFKAVEWAYAAGVTTGSNGRFDPKAYITRQDIAVIIARYAEKKGITLLKANSAATFTDSGKIAPYAIDAVTAAQRAGIISGNSDGSFAPEEYATRAQTAKMIAQLMHGMI